MPFGELPQGVLFYLLLTLLAALISAGQVIYLSKRPLVRGRGYFIGFLLSTVIWALCVVFQTLASTLDSQLYWSKIGYLGISTLPIFWTLFVAKYTDSFMFLLRQKVFAFVIPMITLSLVWTNEQHGLIWSKLTWDATGVLPEILYKQGTWFNFVHTPYSYLLTFLSIFMIVKAMLQFPAEQRRWLFALGIVQVLPISANIAYLIGIFSLDPTPIGLALSSMILTWAVVFENLPERSLVAHHTILNSMKDAVFVLNANSDLVDLNASARQLVNEPLKLGQHIHQYLSHYGGLFDDLKDDGHSLHEYQNRTFNFTVSPIDQPLGYTLLIAQDVTEEKRAERKLEQQLNKLEAIVDMNQELRQLDSLEAVFHKAITSVFDFSKAEFSAILLHDKKEQTLTFVACEGRFRKTKRNFVGSNRSRGESLGWHAVDAKDTVRFCNGEGPEPCNEALFNTPSLSEVKDFVASPMHDKSGEVIAILVANIQEGSNHFEEADIAFIEAIAQACGSALRRLGFLTEVQEQAQQYKTLFDEASRQARELELLNRISSTVAKDLEPDLVIAKTVEAIAEVTSYEQVGLYLLDSEEKWCLQSYYGDSKPKDCFLLNEGLIGRVARKAEAILLHDPSALPRDMVLSEEASSSLAVPLFERENVIGVLAVESLESQHLSQHDLTWVAQLARQIGIAIERAKLYENLRSQEERLRLVTDNMNDIICLHRSDSSYEYVSPSTEAILGYSQEAFMSQPFFDLVHPDDVSFLKTSIFARLAKGDEPKPFQYRIQKASGDYVWIETYASALTASTGRVYGFVSSSRDVTERKQMQEQMLEGALLYDGLTNLPNRTLFMDRLEHMLARQERRENLFAVLFLDLDRFKVVNDSLGHNAGDQLLIEAAQRLLECVRMYDTVARLGGDEFAIILDDVSQEKAEKLAERIIRTLDQPFLIEDYPVQVSASIGITMSDMITDSDGLLRSADLAMYHVKGNGKSGHAVFNTDMHVKAQEGMALELELRQAFEKDEFFLHYQPIIELKNGRILGFEALIRWNNPFRGVVSPAVFIPLAEELGIIPAIDEWVLKEACQQLAYWNEHFQPEKPLTMSVNLSTKNFALANVVGRIEAALTGANLPAALLKLEITESVLMDNADVANDVLEELKAKGVRLQIDDFGTGYSSLSYLHKLPLHALKIDRSFVMGLPGSQEEIAIIASIVALANSLGLDIVAEGIETQEQLLQIQRLGCYAGQGYYFSKPLAVEEIEARFLHESLHVALVHQGQKLVKG